MGLSYEHGIVSSVYAVSLDFYNVFWFKAKGLYVVSASDVSLCRLDEVYYWQVLPREDCYRWRARDGGRCFFRSLFFSGLTFC